MQKIIRRYEFGLRDTFQLNLPPHSDLLSADMAGYRHRIEMWIAMPRCDDPLECIDVTFKAYSGLDVIDRESGKLFTSFRGLDSQMFHLYYKVHGLTTPEKVLERNRLYYENNNQLEDHKNDETQPSNRN